MITDRIEKYYMDEKTRTENNPKELDGSRSVDPGSSPTTSTKAKSPDFRQFLDTVTTSLFSILKFCFLALFLLALFFILIKIYTQEGAVVVPFEVNNMTLSGVSIADQLTSELIRIPQIHDVKYENLSTKTKNGIIFTSSSLSGEKPLGLIVPKSETVESIMADMGNIDIGTGSISLGKLVLAFKNICPRIKKVTTIRGSLQRYGSTIILVALLEGKDLVRSWTLIQPIDNNNDEQLHEMIKDLASMIVYDLQKSKISAKTWEGFEHYTDAWDAYHQYNLSGNPHFLFLACNYSLKAIGSEKEYKKPYDLINLLEITLANSARPGNAIEYCKKTIELNPESSYAWYNNGSVLLIEGNYDNAIRDYDTAINLNRQYAEAWNDKGVALSALGKYDEAIKAYDGAIDLKFELAKDNKGKALDAQGHALIDQGKYNASIQASDKAINIDPKDAIAYNNKGLALYYQHEYDDAIKALDKAIEINPHFAMACYNKGFVLRSLVRTSEANAAFAKAKELGVTG
jgi:tetratricopeptide (TPR) repeat protein